MEAPSWKIFTIFLLQLTSAGVKAETWQHLGLLHNRNSKPIEFVIKVDPILRYCPVATGIGQGHMPPGASRGGDERGAVFFATRNIHKFCELC